MGDIVVTVESDRSGKRMNTIPSTIQYDVMFSYRNLEKETLWVRDIIKILEEDFSIKCCDHERDFKPGKEIAKSIAECLENSLKMVIVLSKEYMSSRWCQHELNSSFFKSNNEGKVSLIPVLIEDCEIPDFLKPLTFIDARGEKKDWLPRLTSAIRSPGEEVVNSKLLLKEKTLRWVELSVLHRENSSLSCGGSVFRKYVPDDLQKYGVEVSSALYEETLNSIAATQIVKGRHCRYPSCAASCCWITVFMLCEFFAIAALGIYFPYHLQDATYIGPAFFWLLLPAFVSCIWLPICILTTQKGKKQIESVLAEINYKMIPLNVMVTIESGTTTKVYFVCYYYDQCCNYLRWMLKNRYQGNKNNDRSPIEDVDDEDSDAIRLQIDEKISENQPLLLEEEMQDFSSNNIADSKDPVKAICSRFAAEFLQKYIREELPISDECHTKKLICLCKYITLHWKEKYKMMTNSEQNVLSTIFSDT